MGVRIEYCLPDTLRRLDPPPTSGSTGSTELLQLLLADDLAAIASSTDALQLFMRHFEAACQRWGLVISSSKTECMVLDPRQQLPAKQWQNSIKCQRCHQLQPEGMLICDCCDQGWHCACLQPPLSAVPEGDWWCPVCAATAEASNCAGSISREAPVYITVAGQPVAWVQKFKYLGSQFSADGSLDAELSYRIQLAAAAFTKLHKPVWRHSCVAVGTKMRILRAMVSSVLLYGAHSWALSAAQLEKLELVQRKQLRHILGKASWMVLPGGSEPPRRISNEALYAACQQSTIEQQLRRIRGQWVGHILRMPNHRLAKQLFFGRITTRAPSQTRRPHPTLLSCYSKDVSTAFSTAELRKFDSDLLTAAASKTEYNNHF